MKFFIFLFTYCFLASYSFANDEVRQSVVRSLIDKTGDNSSFEEVKKDFKINLKNRVILDVNFDENYQTTQRNDEFKSTRANGRLFSTLNLTPRFFINSFFRVREQNQTSENERRESENGSQDRAFVNHGITLEELVLAYDTKKHSLIAGKFNTNYGRAWRWGRGIWYQRMAGDYRQQEKLGFSGLFRAGDAKKTGEYDFAISVFTNDRKNLDNSIITKRDYDLKSDAKPGDTRSLESYVLSMDVEFDFGAQERLFYHFAYTNLAVNKRASSVSASKIADEKGFVAGLTYQYPVNDWFALDGLFEFSENKNIDGNSDVKERYNSYNLIGKINRNWNISLGFASKQNMVAGQNGFDKNISEISFGYDFDKNIIFDRLTLQAGYSNQRNDYRTSLDKINVVGFLMRYFKSF